MRIRCIDVYEVHYRHAAGPFVMSGGRISTEQDGTVVRIETDDGLVGWGEACVISPDYAPGYGPSARAALAVLAPALLGADPRQVEVAYTRMQRAAKGFPDAKSALDMACWDVLGRATGLRLADLLGGAYQETVPLYTGIGLAELDEMVRRCGDALEAGYRSVQVKVGGRVQDDVERATGCAAALAGADCIIFDANGYWSVADAARFAAAVDGLDVFIEQPCATLDECAHLRRTSRRPFILDESLTDVGELVRARAAGAIDAARLKLTRVGGITPVRRMRDLALSFGLPVTIEDAGGGDIVSAALAHLAASVPPRLLLAGYLPSEMTAERIASGTPVARNGEADIPQAPGLGVEVDEAALGRAVLHVE